MVNKKSRILIGSKDNRKEYMDYTHYCECCGGHYQLSVHHHIPQQWTWNGQGYIIDDFINYSTLCVNCHAIIEHNENQYNREIKGKKTFKDFDYWHKLKNNFLPEDYINEYK